MLYLFSYYVLNSHPLRGPKMMETNLLVGHVSSDFHIHVPTITATFGRFLFKGPEQKIHNGETWTPLRLKQRSTNEVIAKLLFSLKLTAKAQQIDGWLSAFSFRSRVVTIRYVCITRSVIRPLQVIIGSCVGPLCLGLFFTLQSKVRFNQSHLMAPNGPKRPQTQPATTTHYKVSLYKRYKWNSYVIAITSLNFLLERVTTWGYNEPPI